MALALGAFLVVLAALAGFVYGPVVAGRLRSRSRRPRERIPDWDPGRELRAERRARELLRSVAGEEAHAMYAELGFVRVARGAEEGRYAYLIYPHRPLIAYDPDSGALLSEYCVAFPDRTGEGAGVRLPDADDVLAKWMAIHGNERNLMADANMHVPGRQLDPGLVHRDLRRLREWEGRRKAAA